MAAPGGAVEADRHASMNDPIPILSLFSGAGGLDLGFEDAGFMPRLALDADPVAIETYNRNRSASGTPGRVADLAVDDPIGILDVWDDVAGSVPPVGVIGGPPCQPFSLSNVHRVEDDPRARMPLVYSAILKAASNRYGNQLRFFVFENVAGLLTMPHRALLDEFKSKFEAAGFTLANPFVLDAQDFDVPQRRRRLFLVGFRKGVGHGRFDVPTGNPWHRRTVRDALSGLAMPMPFARGRRPADVGLHPNHWHMNPLSEKFRNGTNQPGHHLGRSFRMLHWDEPSQTVAFGHREVAVHPSGTRRLSVFEAMLLQGFPPSYELRGTLSDQIRLVSDAVPPPLAAAVASAVMAALREPPPVAHDDRNGHEPQAGLVGVQTLAPKSTSA